MLRVNNILISRISYRILVSIVFCTLTLLVTGRIADVAGYTGIVKFSASGSRTQLAASIFRLVPFYGNRILFIIILISFSTTITYLLINKYINKRNIIDWNLILYLPCLLIYASTPTKELLFFLPALFYIKLECENTIDSDGDKYNLIKQITKVILLTFMVKIRGILTLPYIFLAIIAVLFKSFNLNIIRIRNLNFLILILYSVLICLTFLIFIDKAFIIDKLSSINKFLYSKSIFNNTYDISLINNIYNPFNFIKVQFLAAFPTIEAIIKKPHALLITIESLIILNLFFKLWTRLFSAISKDNKAKLFFSIIFISITCCYFLLYGFLGYANIGASQRFRTNLIPIFFVFPLITEDIIYRNKTKNNSIQKQSF